MTNLITHSLNNIQDIRIKNYELMALGDIYPESKLRHNHLGFSSKSLTSYGILLESFSDKTDGFKKLPNSDPTGYNKQDYLMKIRLNTPKDYKIPAAIELKVSTTDEISNETYLGLTHEDFLVNPLRRYAASALDEMNADHKQMVLTGAVSPIKNLHITASVYNNEFNRNWYKLSEVGGSDISSILNSGNNTFKSCVSKKRYNFLWIRDLTDLEPYIFS